jgi:hypothetical protein
MMKNSHRRNKGQSGSSIVEVALLSPWIFFLFVGILDFGFYAYAAICTQNAARAVVLATAQPAMASVTPCGAALGEMRMLPNVGYSPAATKCKVVNGAPAVTQATPINICVTDLGTGATAGCNLPNAIKCADCSANVNPLNPPSSFLAVVTYQTIPLVPIPLILTGQMTLSRGAEERKTFP